ncbi:MAG: MmgE/PrpD family protein [Proteobacteria bacterium]|nr:MmgE/PrpD family protein [Pseudomonadota bacterium]
MARQAANELSSAPPATIAGALAAFTRGIGDAEVPADVLERAKLHILDAIGTGLAATRHDFARATLEALRSLSDDGSYPVIGMDAGLALRDAALMNGTLIHGLDYDDTHSGGVIHASASAVPVILAEGMRSRASGREALLAYLVGIEASARIGAAAKGGFHQVGFHPTGMVGVFGAALVAGRLKGLDEKQLADAQGIALSMASGTFEFLEEGAWTKRMHPGWAALSGITAASLAASGFVGPKFPFEGRYGLYKCYLGADAEIDWSICSAGLGEVWEMRRVALKPYPICHFNHAFADAALALREAHDLRPEAIDSITALIGEGEIGTVCEPEAKKRRPSNEYDARFSLHYTIAASLVKGRFTRAELSEPCLRDPVILGLCDKIHYERDPQSAFPRCYSGEVIVTTTDGRQLRHRESVNRGAEDRPLGNDEVIAKFHENAAGVMAAERARRLERAVMTLDDPDADLLDVTSLLTPT